MLLLDLALDRHTVAPFTDSNALFPTAARRAGAVLAVILLVALATAAVDSRPQ